MIEFHSDLLLRRWISFSPPPPPTVAVSATGDFSGSSSPAETHIFRGARRRSTGRWQPRRKPAADAPSRAAFLRQRAVHAPARECACFLLRRRASTRRVVRRRLGVLPLRRSNPSPPYPPFGLFLLPPTRTVLLRRLQFISDDFSSSPTPSVHPQSSSVHLQSYSLRFGSPFSSSSSSTAVIRPLIRALFNPNVVQSPVK